MALVLRRADADTRLRIYLNDHLAWATIELAVARRCLSSNQATPLGDYLRGLVMEVDEDRGALARLIRQLGMPIAGPKLLLAAAAQRIGRLKLNGQLTGYSDLSRLVELEGLCAAVDGKACLWRSLQQMSDPKPAILQLPLGDLIARAAEQRRRLEEHRLAAATRALGR